MSLSGGYDFSQLYHASVLAFSPGSTFLATIHNGRLVIRSTSTLSIVRTFQCLLSQTSLPVASSSKDISVIPIVDSLSWSANSLYLLAFSSKSRTAWIFGLTEEGKGEGGEVARIGGEGIEGLVRVEWGRGGRDVLAWSDHSVSSCRLRSMRSVLNAWFKLRLTIHDLSTGRTSHIQNPKSHQNCPSASQSASSRLVDLLRSFVFARR